MTQLSGKDLFEPQEREIFAFSNLKFAVPEEKKEPRRNKRNKFEGRDYRRLLEKAAKRGEKLSKIADSNPDKAENVQRNISWERAFRRATGQKVKDNVEMLKKALQTKQKGKERRKQKWAERKQAVELKKEKRMEKRKENIAKRAKKKGKRRA